MNPLVDEPNLDRSFYLPRLPREYYQADAVVQWPLSVAHRARGWLNDAIHAKARVNRTKLS